MLITDTKYSSIHCRCLLVNKVAEHFGLLLLGIILRNLSLVDTVWLPLSLNIKSLAKTFVDSFLLIEISLTSNYSKCFNFFPFQIVVFTQVSMSNAHKKQILISDEKRFFQVS